MRKKHAKLTIVLWSFLLASLLLVLSGCGQEEPEPPKKMPTSVTIKPLTDLLVDYSFYRPARAISLNDSVLSAELNATVLNIHAQVGDVVDQGAPLIELDCRDENHRLRQSKSQLTASQATATLSQLEYQRGRRLFKQKTLLKQALDRLHSEHERNKANQHSADAAYQLARNSVSKCFIRAPFRAIVMSRSATVGQLATPGLEMVRILDADNLEVTAFLAIDEADILSESHTIYFLQNKKTYPLELRAITPAVDSTRRTREVRLRFTDETPLAGSAGELVWSHPQPALPAEYVSLRGGQLGVLHIRGGSDEAVADSHVDFHVIEHAQEGQPVPIAISPDIANMSVLVDGRFGVSVGETVRRIDRHLQD